MQPLDQQGEELLETQAQALHLVRPPSGGGVLHPAQALDQSAVDVWNDGSEPSGGGSRQSRAILLYNPTSAPRGSLMYLIIAKLLLRLELCVHPDGVFLRRVAPKPGENT